MVLNMYKKGQITLFIILGIVILIAMSFIFNLKYSTEGEDFQQEFIKATNAKEALNALEEYTQTCIEETVIKGIELFGLNEVLVEGYLKDNIEECVNNGAMEFSRQGFDVSTNLGDVSLELTDYAIIVDLDYPIQVDDEETKTEVTNFYSSLPRTIYSEVETDSNCKVTNAVGALSFDKKSKIIIPENTIAKYDDGSCIDEITITLNNPTSRAVSLSPLSYDAGPNGATFYPYAILEFRYTDYDYNQYKSASIAAGLPYADESDLKLTYYDEEDDTHHPYVNELPRLVNKVFPAKNLIYAQVEHFTDLTISHKCTGEANNKYVKAIVPAVNNPDAGTCRSGNEVDVVFSGSVDATDSCTHRTTFTVSSKHPQLDCSGLISIKPAPAGGPWSYACKYRFKDSECVSNPAPWINFKINGLGVSVTAGIEIDHRGNIIAGAVEPASEENSEESSEESNEENVESTTNTTNSSTYLGPGTAGEDACCATDYGYDPPQPCPSGWVNFDCYNRCDVQGACSCSDGTGHGDCSSITKYKSCDHGTLIEKCSRCENCPTGTYCASDESCKIPTCTDSDDLDYYTQGTVGLGADVEIASYEDNCSENILTEHYCQGNLSTSKQVTCLFGCSDGKCLAGSSLTRTEQVIYDDSKVIVIASNIYDANDVATIKFDAKGQSYAESGPAALNIGADFTDRNGATVLEEGYASMIPYIWHIDLTPTTKGKYNVSWEFDDRSGSSSFYVLDETSDDHIEQ